MNVFSLKLTGCRQCRRGDSWRPKNPRIGLWGAGSLWTTVGLTEGRSACHMLIQGTHWARVCVFTRHASSCAWFELQSPDEPHAGPLASCTRALMHSWLPRGEYAFACVATPVPHLNPLTGRPGAPQAPRGPLEYPCKHTHTHTVQAEWKTSHHHLNRFPFSFQLSSRLPSPISLSVFSCHPAHSFALHPITSPPSP